MTPRRRPPPIADGIDDVGRFTSSRTRAPTDLAGLRQHRHAIGLYLGDQANRDKRARMVRLIDGFNMVRQDDGEEYTETYDPVGAWGSIWKSRAFSYKSRELPALPPLHYATRFQTEADHACRPAPPTWGCWIRAYVAPRILRPGPIYDMASDWRSSMALKKKRGRYPPTGRMRYPWGRA
jgi:hypothetical protein